MSNEMIERVAIAVFKYNNYTGSEIYNKEVVDKAWNLLTNSARAAYRNRAKASIQAMREPTEEMIMAYHNDFELESYQAMIDAALKED